MAGMKLFFRRIHLYLGLTAGIVISITCLTGAALVFEKELQSVIYPERYYVKPQEVTVPLSELVTSLRRHVPEAKVAGIKIYKDPKRSVEISFTEEDQKPHTAAASKKPQAGAGPASNQAFMNPYTGNLISLYTHRNSFFYTIFSLHRWLLAGDAGKLIVGVSTSIFLFILITGFVLWWPEKKKKLKQRLRVKFGAGWKRLLHDLHITLGFYSAIFLFLFAFTGLAWSFEWFNNSIYWVTRSDNKRSEPPASVYAGTSTPVDLDRIFSSVKQTVREVQYYAVALPRDSSASFAVTVLSENPVHEKASDQYYFDQYTGNLIGTNLYRDRNPGQKTRSIFYSIHVGSIAGLPGRIVAFGACILGFTFPVTGVILWLNRLKKQKRKSARDRSSHKLPPYEEQIRKTKSA
jgi:uncharacterized iron-regulated membrane protein